MKIHPRPFWLVCQKNTTSGEPMVLRFFLLRVDNAILLKLRSDPTRILRGRGSGHASNNAVRQCPPSCDCIVSWLGVELFVTISSMAG